MLTGEVFDWPYTSKITKVFNILTISNNSCAASNVAIFIFDFCTDKAIKIPLNQSEQK